MNKYPGGVDDDSIATQLKNTTDQVAGTFQSLLAVPSEQPTAEHTSETSQPLMQAEEEESEMNNQTAKEDDSLETQMANTRAEVARTFEKLSDPNSTLAKIGAILNPSRERGGKMKYRPPNDDDSFLTQVKHAEAEVIETFKCLSVSLQLAGKKIKGVCPKRK